MHPNDTAQLDLWMSELRTRLAHERGFTNIYAAKRRANMIRAIGMIFAALTRI
jgi:hypothetical protein